MSVDSRGPRGARMQKTPLTYSLIILLVLAVSYLSLITLPAPTIHWLAREDGPFETFGALCLLISSLTFLILYLNDRRGNCIFSLNTQRNVFFVIFALAFFFAFGEEISWGQRIFHFATPESLREINRQEEFNIHNIRIFHGSDVTGRRKLLNMDRAFSVFWFLYCVAIPVGVRFHERMANQLRRVNLPLVPIWLGLFFPVNYLLSKLIALAPHYAEFKDFNHSTVEVKESLFAFLFVLVALYFVQQSRRLTSQKARVDT